MMGLAFVHPRVLLLLAMLAGAGAAALVAVERRRRAQLAAFGERRLLERAGPLPGSRRRLAAHVLALACLCLALAALARPQFGAKPVVLTRTGRDVLFALDLSRSMNAEDVPPSRLSAAKQAIREVLEASPGDRVGLAVFGGSAFLQVPLTLDRAAFDLFLAAARTDDISDPGTNLPAALAAAATAFGDDSEPRYRVVVLLSDGESLEGDPSRAIAALREEGIRVFTVGVGSREGAPIPERAAGQLMGYHRDESGQVVVTRLDEETLRRVASATGGSYLRLTGGASVRQLAGEIAHLEKREISSHLFTQLLDRYQWPLALALAALFLASLLEVAPAAGRRGPRSAAAKRVFLLAMASMAFAPPVRLAAQQGIDPSDGESLYRAGLFQEAYDAFQLAIQKGERSAALSYDTGNTLYRLGRYDAAVGSFREALAESSAVRQPSTYNLGNAFVKASESQDERQEDLRRAIAAYEQALLLSPEDKDAKWNLELALRKLEEEDQRQEQQGGGGGGDGQGGGGEEEEKQKGAQGDSGGQSDQPQPRPGPQNPEEQEGEQAPSPTALTEEQARRLLEAIQSEEGEVLESRNRGRARAASGAKDW
jgi:Ca-activated chloride channel family protein